MKKLLLLLCIVLCPCMAFADQIHYGYNAKGEYVPVSVNGRTINYGYNAQGDYVPVSTTNQRNYQDTEYINYGYNAQGQYVPVSTSNPYRDRNRYRY